VAASGGSERMSVVTFSVGCSSGSADHWPAQAFGFLLQSTRWVQTCVFAIGNQQKYQKNSALFPKPQFTFFSTI